MHVNLVHLHSLDGYFIDSNTVNYSQRILKQPAKNVIITNKQIAIYPTNERLMELPGLLVRQLHS